MSARSITLAALSLGLLPVLSAQTVVPAGTTPAPAKADLSGQSAVMETMSLLMRFAKDGSSIRTLTVNEHVLSDAGVRDQGIVSIPYASATETVHFDYVRVRKQTGAAVETPAGDAQEVPLPVTQQAPMYSDLRMKQLPVRSLAVGDTLEYQVTVKDTNTDGAGAFWRVVPFLDSMPVKQEIVELRVPRDLPVMVKSKKIQPVVSEDGGERVYRWRNETASEYPKKDEKDNTAAVNTIQEIYEPDIAITSFHSWAEVGAWYRGLMKDRVTPDAAIQAKADELTRGLTTDDAKIDAIYNYVSTQYRYVAVSLGIGRLQPHTAADVFRNQYGDCKDKHTLLQAMLAAEKITAQPVLIGSSINVNEGLPMPSQFDHVITLVKLSGRDVWLDSTPEIAPSRMLLAALRDKLALAVPATGEARLVRTVATLPFRSFARETITGKLDTHGLLTAHFDETMRGDTEVIYRELYHQVARAQWQQLEQNISYRSGFAGDVSAVDASLPEKTADPFHVSWDYTRKDFGEPESRRFPGLSPMFEGKFADDATAPKLAMLLDPTSETEVKVTLTLPEGYTATAPPDFTHSTAFAEYTSTYKVKDRTLEMDRTLRYKVHELPVSEFAAYRDFLKAVSDDAGQMIQMVAVKIAPSSPAAKSAVPSAGTATGASSVSSTAPAKGGASQMPFVPVVQNQVAAEWIAQARAKLQAGDLEATGELLEKAKQANEKEPGLWDAFGDVHWRRGNIADAIDAYSKEVELHPDSSAAYQRLVNAYLQQGDWTSGEQVLRAWCKAEPSNVQALALLASSLMSLERFKEAAEAYQKIIPLSPKPERFQVQLGRAQLKSRQTDAGRATLHAVMDHSNDAMTLNNAAYELADADLTLESDQTASRRAVDMIEAITVKTTLENATDEDLRAARMLSENWDTLGWIEFHKHRLAEAEDYTRSAWLLDMHAEVGLHLGQIYEAEGKKQEAIAVYRQAAAVLYAQHPWPMYARMKETMLTRAAVLSSEFHEAGSGNASGQNDQPADMLLYTIANPLHGSHGRAEFLLLMENSKAPSVLYLRGDAALKPAAASIENVTYRAAIPSGSAAKILRRASLACTVGAETCQLRLVKPSEARMAK